MFCYRFGTCVFLFGIAASTVTQAQTTYVNSIAVFDDVKVRQYDAVLSREGDLKPLAVFANKLAQVEGFVVEPETQINNRLNPKRPICLTRFDPHLSRPIKYFKSLKMITSIGSSITYEVNFRDKPPRDYLTRFGSLLGEFDARQRGKGIWEKVLANQMDLIVQYTERKKGRVWRYILRYSGDFWNFVK